MGLNESRMVPSSEKFSHKMNKEEKSVVNDVVSRNI
jgi:hypothetical protein